MPDAPIIELVEVTKLHGGRAALDHVSLAIDAGSFVALVGPSGSGKTTLLKTINRLVTPDAGTVRIDGEDGASQPVHQLRRRIGYVFQGIGLFPHMTVAENIRIVPEISGASDDRLDGRVDELLDLVALPRDMARRHPRTLSGGQAQRVGFARALAAKPAIMLLDEPFGALDPVTRDELGRAYRALHDRLGLTSLMVTHDMSEALLLADRVIVLLAGRIHADATPEALLAGPGDPEVRRLIELPLRRAERLAGIARG